MGRIKELRQKVEDGTATPEETEELTELESEASAGEETTEETEATEATETEEDKAVDKAADAIFDKVAGKLNKVLEAIDKGKKEDVKVTKDPVFVVDKKLGKVSVEELDNIKIPIAERKKAGKEFKEVTGKTIHFLDALLRSDREKLQLLTEGTGSAGGFLVPEEFANLIVEDLRDATVMRQLAKQMTIQSDTLHLPRLDTRPKAQWRSEGAVKSTSTAQFSELTFTPYSLASIVGLSKELSMDASLGVNGSIVNYIAGLMTQAIAEEEDKAFWTGSGTGRPTGINTYTLGQIDVAGTDSAHADAIIQTYFRLEQGYRKNAVWVANQAVLEKVGTLKDSQNNYLMKRLGDTPYNTILGRPFFEQNDLATTELFFGDFSYYMIVDREGIQVDTSTEATVASQSAFERNLVFVRVEKRVDGELTLNEAVREIINF